jgi:hypothetical protein
VVISAAKGFVLARKPSLLVENGGSLSIDRSWAISFLRRMGYVQCKATKAARKVPAEFDQIKEEFMQRVADPVRQHSIPQELIANIDQTGMKLVPASEWTMETRGSKQVPVLGLEDKREVTALFGISLANQLLPPQIIYAGKTKRCHPEVNFPVDWNITHSTSHWSTKDTMLEYVDAVLMPFFAKQKQTLGLDETQKSLLILDVFASHRTPEFLQKLQESNICVVFIPPGCTGELQPLDVGFNNDFKQAMKAEFSSWYAHTVAKQIAAGVCPNDVKVDLAMSVIKPLHARWLIDTMKIMETKEETMMKAWRNSGISQAVLSETSPTTVTIHITGH